VADELRGRLYVDSSALVKLFVPEPESAELNQLLRGRRDLVVSDLAVTEIVSAAARRVRAGELAAEDARRLHGALLGDLEAGYFLPARMTTETHRAAERSLLQLQTSLRAADALHLALAQGEEAQTLITFDLRLRDAARAAGFAVAP
jgi:predicted nucleic acid-binding protein